MKKIVLGACAFLLLTGRLFALSDRVAISDFMVHSNNPRYEFMGKGISAMIAVELRKSPDVDLIERENRVQLLGEMEFSLSDLAESETQIEVGKLLAANYLVFGELIDMDPEFLISLRMAEVKSGKVIWSDKLVESLTNYDFITGYFARSILSQLGARVQETTEGKAASKTQKSEEAVIALSRAIDHYDRKETEEARRELTRAKRIDPDSEAADFYLSKLVVNTTKFKVITEPYYSYQNPAFLGILKTDMISLSAGTHVYGIITHNPIEYINYISFADDKSISEYDVSLHSSYALPLGEKLGMRADCVLYNKMDRYWQGSYDAQVSGGSTNRWGLGGMLDFGCSLRHGLAVGLGIGFFSGSTADQGPWVPVTDSEKIVFSGNFGLLYRTPDERFIFDARLGYSSETYDVIDTDTLTVEKVTDAPIFWENTFTFASKEKTTFFNLKQLNDLSIDRNFYYTRLLPAVEHFFSDWFSARLGLEGSLAFLNESKKAGYGVLGGMTFRIIRWHCDIDMNMTYRMRPSRVVEELLYPDFITLVGVSFSDVFRSRDPEG
jgi:TolB-like protein